MKNRVLMAGLMAGIVLGLFLSVAEAGVPHLINYQGKLTDSAGQPLEGSYNLTFRIYDAQTAGNLLWQEAQAGVLVQKGIFNIMLGSVSALNIPFDIPYYLEIKVGDEVMSPRQQITSAGYALRAEKADDSVTFSGKATTDFVLASDVTAAPTANKAVKMDASAKLPVAALKTYDSGWFAVALNNTYAKTHNLGTTKVLASVYFSQNSDGSGRCFQIAQADSDSGTQGQCSIVALSTTTVKLRTSAGAFIIDMKDENGTTVQINSGYARIIILALE